MPFLHKIDKLQQRIKPAAFSVAVIKKYSDDEGGRLAALITYYSFLSLFPLLLVATTATQLFVRGHEHLRQRVIDGISHYFPVISSDLQNSIHSYHKTGLALALGVLLTLYGARGGAAAIRYAFNQIWQVPEKTRPGFPGQFQQPVNSFSGRRRADSGLRFIWLCHRIDPCFYVQDCAICHKPVAIDRSFLLRVQLRYKFSRTN